MNYFSANTVNYLTTEANQFVQSNDYSIDLYFYLSNSNKTLTANTITATTRYITLSFSATTVLSAESLNNGVIFYNEGYGSDGYYTIYNGSASTITTKGKFKFEN